MSQNGQTHFKVCLTILGHYALESSLRIIEQHVLIKHKELWKKNV